jgi:hypothetical protein
LSSGNQVTEPESAVRKVTFAVFVLAVSSTFVLPIFDPEFFGALTRGNAVLATGSIMTRYIWTDAGYPFEWVHSEWLFDAALAWLHPRADESGLTFALLGLQFFLLYSLVSLFQKCSGQKALSVLLAVMTFTAISYRGALLPPLCGWIFIIFALRWIHSPIIVFLCGVLLANLYASALLYTILCVVFSGRSHRGSALAILLALFVTPSGVGAAVQYVTVFFSGEHIGELANLKIRGALAILVTAIWAAIFAGRKAHTAKFESIAAVALMAGALFFDSSLSDAAVIAVAFSGALLAGAGSESERSNVEITIEGIGKKLAALPAVGVVWLCGAISLVNVVKSLAEPRTNARIPARAADELVEKRITGPLFHEKSIGSYLIYRFSNGHGMPFRRAFLDAQSAFLDEKRRLLAEDPKRPPKLSQLESMGIKTVLCRQSDKLFTDLSSDPAWEILYLDALPTSHAGAARFIEVWAIFTKRRDSRSMDQA